MDQNSQLSQDGETLDPQEESPRPLERGWHGLTDEEFRREQEIEQIFQSSP
jgi:DNA polymerase III epsilon subunit-like protein